MVYLNGREVFRAGLPDGDVSAETLAIVGVASDWQSSPQTTLIAPGLLKDGENVLAAAVFRAQSDTTGLWLDVGLVGL